MDIGANQGYFSEQVVGVAGELHSIEPDPDVFRVLEDTLSDKENVKFYNVAIGDRDGEVRFFRQKDFDTDDPVRNSVGSSVFDEHQAVDSSSSFVVPQMGILTLLESISKPVDLMKMDIEGAEVPVLEKLLDSPLAANISTLLVETHEHVLPGLVDRTFALRKRVKGISRPRVIMEWQ